MNTDFKNLRRELQCQWVGPMPIKSFLQEFLEIDQSKLEEKPKLPEEYYFDTISHAETLSEMRLSFIKLVRDSGIMPNLELFPCLDNDPENERKSKPDIVVYGADFKGNPDQTVAYEHSQLIFQFGQGNLNIDIFEDLSEEGTGADLERFVSQLKNQVTDKCRAQLTYYARAWMSRGHRTHCFMVWVAESWARIIRFDRSGAIVTERLDIHSNGHLLLEFLWRFSCASPAMRGKDTTVSTVTDMTTIKLAQEKLNKWAPDPRSQHVLELMILDEGPVENSRWRNVLVWGPLADCQCVVGRATRGYPAWDLKDEKLIFVKDSWRDLADEFSKETRILETLNKAKVCNVSTFLCGDDLPGQVTRTQEFASADWNRGSRPETLSQRSHIRFASDLIGTPLTKFKCSKQFVQAWLDALLAHKEAYEKCGILHRDISLNNILLTPGGGGFLNDWDLARTLDEIESGPRPTRRFGTWQFMSINLLRTPDKKHTLQDDLEAFFWVLLYVIIRYLNTSLVEARKSIPKVMTNIFDASTADGIESRGGWYKKDVVLDSMQIGSDFSVKDNAPLTLLVNDILRIVGLHALYWINFTREVERIAEEDDLTKETATARYQIREKILKLSNHTAMVQFAVKALAENWPTDDGPSDHCATDEPRPTTRYAGDTSLTDAPGSGPERTAKRAKQ